jgi:sulfite dehydrogenase (cytochrome) subunit B
MKIVLICAALMLAVPARAAEKPIELKPGPERDTVAANCGACHTVDYIGTNSPFMDRAVWTAEVNKMINAFGAPIAAPDAARIIDYLVKNYGK